MVRKGHRDCPVCFEEIKVGALVCRFCGAVLTDKPLPSFLPKSQAEAIEREREQAAAAAEKELASRKRAGRRRGVQRPTVESPLPDREIKELVDLRFAHVQADITARHRKRLQHFLEHASDEYRAASVLFVDITGYTALSERMKTEYVKDLLEGFYEICARTVERYNGFIVKFEADCCLAVFGAPLAYDRDVEACVRAAVEIRDQIRLFPLVGGQRIHVAAGIDTGEILTSFVAHGNRRGFDIYGPTVNLASRIQKAAKRDEVLVSAATYRQVAGVFDCRRRPARKFKNVAKPVVTYAVGGEKGTAVERRDSSTLFVGREKELGKLQYVWREFIANWKEQGASVAQSRRNVGSGPPFGARIRGDAGIGKTRLVFEFLKGRSENPLVLSAESNPHDVRIPYGAWRAVLRSLWGGRAGDAVDKQRKSLHSLIAETLGRNAELPGLTAIFGLPEALEQARAMGPAALRRQMEADLRQLLSGLARKRPVVLFFDDLQWIDPSSLALLDALNAAPFLRGVCCFLAYRLESKVTQPHLRQLVRIRLSALEEKSRNALIGTLLQLDEMAPEISRMISTQASGNPLFLIEMIRNVLENLEETDEDLHGKALVDRVREWVPGSLKDLLQARIDLLDQRRRLVLQCGSVLGQRFAYRIISFFDSIRDGLLGRLYSLKSLEFLDSLGSAGDLEFLFRHHLIRETAYQGLLDSQRREFHRLVAERLEEQHKNSLDDVSPVLAYHYEQCREWDRAVQFLERAGARAADQAASPEAIAFYESAIRHLLRGEPSPQDRERARRDLRELGRLHRLAGECQKAMQCFERGQRLPAVRGENVCRTEYAAEIGLTRLAQSNYPEARAELMAARRMARGAKNLSLRAMILAGLGSCCWGEGNLAEARKLYQQVLKIRLPKAHLATHADAQNDLALVEWRTGQLDRALEQFRAAGRSYQRIGQRFGMALTLMNAAIIEESQGRWVLARRHYAESLRQAERIGFVQLQAAAHGNLGNLALVEERFTDAMDHSARSLALARSIGDRRSEAIALENMALGHLGLAQFMEADNTLKEARRLARPIGDAERLCSLILVEIEVELGRSGTRKQKRLLTAAQRKRLLGKILMARRMIAKGGYRAELPRLLRLELQMLRLAGDHSAAEATRIEALQECARQNNRTEEHRIRSLNTPKPSK